MKTWIVRLFVAGIGLLSTSCPRNPATGARQLNLVSQEEEIALGKRGVDEIATTMGFYDDEALQRYVSEVGMKLAQVSERPGLPWSFRVVDDAAVNAFALPGGPIFVTRGLLAHLKDEAQLAIVLGHEIGHVTAEHSVNQLSKAQLAQVGIGLGAMVSEKLAGLGEGGLSLLFLKFGRDDERQSDELALRYAARAGYDVRVAPEVFEVLRRVGESAAADARGRLPGWLATHPDPGERAQTMRATLARRDPQSFAGSRREEERLMQALDGLAYGDDPREGIVRANRFYHPGLRFQVTFPPGFRLTNMKRQVIGEHPDGAGAMLIALAAPAPAEALLKRFFADSGATQAGPMAPLGKATAAPFRAETDDGPVAGMIAFLRRGEQTFQFVTISSPTRADAFATAFRTMVTSFGPLADPALLRAKPARLEVDKLPAELQLRALQREHPALSIEELARVNQVETEAVLPPGALVKWVDDRR